MPLPEIMSESGMKPLANSEELVQHRLSQLGLAESLFPFRVLCQVVPRLLERRRALIRC